MGRGGGRGSWDPLGTVWGPRPPFELLLGLRLRSEWTSNGKTRCGLAIAPVAALVAAPAAVRDAVPVVVFAVIIVAAHVAALVAALLGEHTY